MASVWKPAKACLDFNNDFTLFTAVPALSNMYTDKDSNLISDLDIMIGYPDCGKEYQNSASLHKHGREEHRIQVIASGEEH